MENLIDNDHHKIITSDTKANIRLEIDMFVSTNYLGLCLGHSLTHLAIFNSLFNLRN